MDLPVPGQRSVGTCQYTWSKVSMDLPVPGQRSVGTWSEVSNTGHLVNPYGPAIYYIVPSK